MTTAPRKTTPQDRVLGTIKVGKYLVNMGSPAFPGGSYPTPLVAGPASTQLTATLCPNDLNFVGTCPTNGSLMLPPTEVGREVTIINGGAGTGLLYGNPVDTGSGTINGVAGTTPVSVTNSTPVIAYCVAPGSWWTK